MKPMMNRLLQISMPVARLSGKFWAVTGFWASSLLFLLFQGGKLAVMTFGVVTVLCLYLLLGKWSGIHKARGTRVLADGESLKELEAGTQLKVNLKVQIPGFWPLPYVVLEDRLQRKNGETLSFEGSFVPDWRRRGQLDYTSAPLRRGNYTFLETVCYTEDIFGLFAHKSTMPLKSVLQVYPKSVVIRHWPVFYRLSRGMYHHAVTTRAQRETTQINGVRDYTYGDRISRIHWNATARTGVWKSKEFERETLPKMVIVLDSHRHSYSRPYDFELAVSVAASMIKYGLKEELAQGLLAEGHESGWDDIGRGTSHYHRLHNRLIEIEAVGKEPIHAVVRRRADLFPRDSFLVMISPRKDEEMLRMLDWLKARNMPVCHISVPGGNQQEGSMDWLKALNSGGHTGYDVEKLEQLPWLLGGRTG